MKSDADDQATSARWWTRILAGRVAAAHGKTAARCALNRAALIGRIGVRCTLPTARDALHASDQRPRPTCRSTGFGCWASSPSSSRPSSSIEPGLTGVVGPNGCGKSNLLEALRWVMGETSHKRMRAAAMDDVIFSGTSTRPARNIAEVTIFLDNSERQAPAEFNDNDVLEVTRRIEREAGSAYRINGREVRARDVKILFEDAATGARSPALVRQGQIAEIVNAKPEQRRRILEDAAGIAGLHSRRHEAELRLKAAEGNLARLDDILGQLHSQIESLKRQARQARRYKELSAEIRKAEALLSPSVAGPKRRPRSMPRRKNLQPRWNAARLAHRSGGKALRAEAEAADTHPAAARSRRRPRARCCIASRSSRTTSSARPSAPPRASANSRHGSDAAGARLARETHR